jgi:GT2 family glycosyltransferase
MGVRLAALIVNYESAAYALALVRSLREQWSRCGRAADELEISLVDNASPSDPARELAAVEAQGARVVRETRNLGYAAGMNRALEQTRGSSADFVLVLNPDLAFFPGALAQLLNVAREHPRLGALGPRAFLDPARNWRMPPNRLPTAHGECLQLLAVQDPALSSRLSDERTQHALREWTAREPIEVEMLSGACLLLSRAAIAAAGGLFDERYPLYYEDTDLFQRLSRAGLELVLDPRAEIVHHWARSSGIESAAVEPARRLALSRAAYFERWFDERERAMLAQAGGRSLTPSREIEARFRPLGVCSSPPRFEFPRAGRWLVEVAMLPGFPLAAGALVEGNQWRMDERAWEWFYRGRYFVRAVDLSDSSEAAAWTFDKPTLARTRPLEPAELDRESMRPQ